MGASQQEIEISGPLALEADAVAELLHALPQWFGVESALRQYAIDTATLPNFAAMRDGRLAGFATLRVHNPQGAEVHCIAVHPRWHGRGLGRGLIDAARAWWRAQGGRALQVKTIGPSDPDPHYARTRRFYARCGFVALEESRAVWPGYSCLQLVMMVD